MRHETSVMGDLLKRSPWDRFDTIVDNHAADRRVRTLSTKSQLMARLHGQLSGAVSLREIVTTMSSHEARLYHLGAVAPKRSTLADANAQWTAEVFAELFGVLVGQAHRGLRKHTRDAIRLVDASRVTLNSLSRGWAHYDAPCDGAKLHAVFDPNAALPVHFAVSTARKRHGESPRDAHRSRRDLRL